LQKTGKKRKGRGGGAIKKELKEKKQLKTRR